MIYVDDSEPDEVLDPVFPYRDVTIKRDVDANNLYEILGEVGRGKFGTVYRCREKSTDLKLAAKFVPIPKREDRRNVEREVEIMNSLQHHLIIQLYAAYEYQKMMCVVLELVEGGELFDRIVDDEFVLTERVCIVFIRQVCEAMEFIHRNNILHLDLKPENILCLTQEGNRVKIIDFGLARKFDPDKKLQILFGTPEFVAPEVVNFDCISYATDMWSVGVICYVLISGLSPFMGETDIETMANVTIAKYDFEDESFSNVSPECVDFIAKLLIKDVSTRMTAAECLTHKWLQRRPKAPASPASPAATPQPTTVPSTSPKLKRKAASPASKHPQDDNEDAEVSKELETTKDNLKNFIERWEEHPNSPYVFDVESNVIAPLGGGGDTSYLKPNGGDSISSSRVCSPSPCESIGTVTDDEEDRRQNEEDDDGIATPINESREKLFPIAAGKDSPTPTATQYAPAHLFAHELDEQNAANSSNLQDRSLQSYLHTFDRRNSDTNYLLGRRSSGERVNLAEEIRKLSDHLLMLAEINTKFGIDATTTKVETSAASTNSNDANNNLSKGAKSPASPKKSTTSNKSKSSSSSTLTSTSKKTSASSTAAIKSTSNSSSSTFSQSSQTNTTITSSSVSQTVASSNSKLNTLSLRLQQSIEETPKKVLPNGSASWRTSQKKKKTTTINSVDAATKNRSKTPIQSLLESTSSRRAKFRINQMSRDVPIGLPDTHQTVNLEEAANTTKDCLLHLLEKYNETRVRNPLGRHQSISVDCNISDNLEYRSMSSINAFFQRHNNTGQNVKQLQAHLESKGMKK